MDAVVDFLRRLPAQIAAAGGSPPARAGVLLLALVLNVGFYLPSLPVDTPGENLPGADKLVHLLVFALTVWAAGRLLAPVRRFPMGWVVLVALGHALLIELVQLLVLPQRSGEWADVLVDVLGIALGTGLWILERGRARRAELGADEGISPRT